MKANFVKLKDYNTYEECMEAIHLIENCASNVVGGEKAFHSGYQTTLTKTAQNKIKALEARANRMLPDEEEGESTEEQMNTDEVIEPMVRCYLRASTDEQDAKRSKQELKAFAKQHGKRVAAYYIENITGTTLERPELLKMLDESERGDIILIEHIDRLSRLNKEDWDLLKAELNTKGLRLCIVSTPMTHSVMSDGEAANWMMQAINELVIELGASMARADYELRRKRQAQAIKDIKEGKRLTKTGKTYDEAYKGGTGRKKNKELHKLIAQRVREGQTNKQIADALGCSTKTVQRFKKETN